MSLFRSKGEKNFARCQHKDVTFRPRYYIDNAGTTDFLDRIKSFAYGESSVSASAACPQIPEVKTDHYNSSQYGPKNQEAALKNLGEVAAELGCKNCLLVDMTPVEVAQKRIDDARALTSALEAEARLATARAELEALQKRIADGDYVSANGLTYTPQDPR